MNHTATKYLFILLLLGTAFSMQAHAGEDPGPLLADTLAEVVVNDQRMGAMQQSRSNPETKLFMKRLEQEQKVSVKDISAMVPNLYIPDYGSKMTSSIYMRGLGARIDQPVMGMYIDGIGLSNKNSFDYDLYDIRSVSVHRGPQGTLFGRNAIGGIVHVTTLSPFNYQGIRAAVGYGNGNTANARLSCYQKINDRLGVGLSAYYKHSDGFFQNHYSAYQTEDKNDSPYPLCDQSNEMGGRLRMEWLGRNDVRISNTLIYNRVEQGGFPYHFIDQPICYNDVCSYRRNNLIEGLNYSFSAGDYQLSGSTSYQFLSDVMDMDQDYQPLSYFTLQQAQKEHSIAQEFSIRPKTQKDRAWNWISGISLSYRHNNMEAPVTFKQDGIDSLILKNANNGIAHSFPNARIAIKENQFVIDSRFVTNHANAAIYHTSYYRINEHWQMEAGLRLDGEYSHFDYLSQAEIHYLFTETMSQYRPLQTHLSGKEHLSYIELLPKLAATYQRKDWSVYGSVAEGYKAGGFNTQLFSDILQNKMMQDMMSDMGVYFSESSDGYQVSEVIKYKPERCFQFELGASGHHDIGNSRLSGSANLFWMEIINQQLTVFPKNATGRMMTNSGRSRSIGAEWTIDYHRPQLAVNIAYGYTNARFVSYHDGKNNYAGNRLPYAPSHTFTANATRRFTFQHHHLQSLDINMNMQGIGSIWWDEANLVQQPFYVLLNGNITLHTKWCSLEWWCKNITRTQYNTFYFVSMNNVFVQSGKPLTFGGTVRIDLPW